MEPEQSPLPFTEQDQIQTKENPTSASTWRRKSAHAELQLPSGNVCLARNPGMQHFLRTGVIPNSLRGIISQAIAGQTKELRPQDMVNSEEDIDAIFELFDNVLLEVVVEPKVKPTPVDEEGKVIPVDERDLNYIYIDEVDFDDKLFIFQFAVGGTRDLERFRQGQSEALAAVQSGEGIPMPTQPATGD